MKKCNTRRCKITILFVMLSSLDVVLANDKKNKSRVPSLKLNKVPEKIEKKKEKIEEIPPIRRGAAVSGFQLNLDTMIVPEPLLGFFTEQQVNAVARLHAKIYKLFNNNGFQLTISTLSPEILNLINQPSLEEMQEYFDIYDIPPFDILLHSYLTSVSKHDQVSPIEKRYHKVLFLLISTSYALENNNTDFIQDLLNAGVSGNGALLAPSICETEGKYKSRLRIYGLKMLHLVRNPKMIDVIMKYGDHVDPNATDIREMGAIEYHTMKAHYDLVYRIGDFGGVFYPSIAYPKYEYLRNLIHQNQEI